MAASTTPLVSIITPVYNAERYIARCIRSVLEQTYPYWEQLIIDDGSSDGTRAIVESFLDARIKYLPLPHRGLPALAATYNHGLAHARGELVAVLEGDDFWPAGKLARQVPVFAQPDIQIAWGSAMTVDDAGRELRRWRQPAEGTQPGRTSLATLFKVLTRKNVLTPAATVMIRRSALDRAGGFRQTGGPLFVDLPTWLHVCAVNEGFACYQPVTLAFYRVHAQQTSAQRDHEMRHQHFDVVTAVLEQLPIPAVDRLQWGPADARAARASAALTRGIASLGASQRREAFRLFRNSFGDSRVARERLGALLGMVSAASGVNLIGVAQRVETRWRGESSFS